MNLTVEVDTYRLEVVLGALANLSPQRIGKLHLILASDGYFTKRTRPLAEAEAKRVLARFPTAELTSARR